MSRKDSVQTIVRFSLEDERDRRIYKTLNELNLDIHKSKNKFIKNAIDAYINGINADNSPFMYAGNAGVTEKALEMRLEQIKSEIRTELYQEFMAVFMKAGLNNLSLGTQQMMPMQQANILVPTEKENEVLDNAPTEEMMEDIMKWS
ncbi:MAG: hypothetical protein J6C01_08960 [Lachnospiraceae bacterium]|nr:hypothetical protein [Lachnospiraceae bacterium]